MYTSLSRCEWDCRYAYVISLVYDRSDGMDAAIIKAKRCDKLWNVGSLLSMDVSISPA